ncbi:MAG TPA: HIRAN domain-containing protein [Longimicrobiaceae bacterium]|nr:HIRAN domain-containing protein [Longimicrobiaceae bacterium]
MIEVEDSLEVFPEPEPRPDGSYHIHFFAHGLRHFPPSSMERAKELRPGERLLLMRDFQNGHDPRAIMLRTAGQSPGDVYPVGFCPRYLLDDLLALLERNPGQATVEVKRTNLPPAPVQFRLLCSLTMHWPEGFRPFSGPDYQPISEYADEPISSMSIA